MKRIESIVIFILFSFNIYSQEKFVISNNDLFGQRVFVKNNGQFNNVLQESQEIFYGYVNGDEQVYFTAKGPIYLLQQKEKQNEFERERIEQGKMKERPLKSCFIDINWENSNPNIEIIAGELQSFYHSYGEEKYKSSCYKKITYKNVYNNIDIEYLLQNEKKDGIKYNVILHPGANISDIKIKYSGDIKKMLLKDGALVIKTEIIDVMELAPISFQNGNNIGSEFLLKDNVLSFNLPNGYDDSKELVIDPFVQNLALATNNCGYDVDYDYAGNYYVYGGSGPFLVSKYSPLGSLIWTFQGYIPSVSWPADYLNSKKASNFVVEKTSEKVYIGEGPNLSGAKVVRLDQNGIYDNFIAGTSSLCEIWEMGFNCNDGSLFGLGGSTGAAIVNNNSGILINTSNGAVTTQNFTGLTTAQQDVVCHAIDPSGTIFYLFTSNQTTSIDNCLMKVNSSFNGNTWIVPSTYSNFVEAQVKHYPNLGLISYSSNGFNALAVNSNYLFFYDGYNLSAHNKTNGNKIGFTMLSGQTAMVQGGIAVDECNNIYVGGNGFIRCFNFDGTNFVANGSIPINISVTNKYITDIRYYSSTNQLYVCGTGFGGIYHAINSSVCGQLTITTNCTDGVGSATATLTSNSPNPFVTYTWTDLSTDTIVNQTINSNSLTNVVNNLANGVYSIRVQVDAPCGPVYMDTITINCDCPELDTLLPINGSNTICEGSTNSYTVPVVIGATSYVWSLPTGWIGTSTTNSISTTANFSGGEISVFAMNECDSTNTVFINISIGIQPIITASSNSPICEGESLLLTANSSSTSISTYSWSGPNGFLSTVQNPIILNSTMENLGQYIVVVNADGCEVTENLDIVIYPKPEAIFTPSPCILTTYQNNAIMINNSMGAVSYEWDFGDNSNSTMTNPNHTFEIADQDHYLVTLFATSEFGCIDSTYETIIINEEIIFYVPNTFTPDGNNFNQLFQPVFSSDFDVSGYSLSIYDRWGVLIFETNNISEGWSGKIDYKNQIVQDGTYTWKIGIKSKSNSEQKIIIGHVNVLK